MTSSDSPHRTERALRPRSILQLVVGGYVIVSLPLAAALVAAYVWVGDLSSQGREAVDAAAESMRLSQTLVDLAGGMERNARQYAVLGDAELLEVYRARRAEFIETIEGLRGVVRDSARAKLLEEVSESERRLHTAVLDEPEPEGLARGFAELDELARRVRVAGLVAIGEETRQIQATADATLTLLTWSIFGLVPLAVLLAAVAATVIHRPLRDLHGAIRRIGTGEPAAPARVSGPTDLRELGERLEWLQQRLADLERQKVDFLRHMSHELKTPLSALREGAQLLGDGVGGQLSPRQSEIVDILRDRAIDLQSHIEDLLEYSVRPTPLASSTIAALDLGSLLERVIADQRLAAESRHVRIEREVEPVPVTGDPEQLRVVLDNLLSNAIKYSPAEAAVRVRVRREGNRALVDVLDSGPGIDPSERERVFEPFFRGSAVHSAGVKGSGLGLGIAREYVSAHHGAIEVVEAEHGAHLRVTLPVGRGEHEA